MDNLIRFGYVQGYVQCYVYGDEWRMGVIGSIHEVIFERYTRPYAVSTRPTRPLLDHLDPKRYMHDQHDLSSIISTLCSIHTTNTNTIRCFHDRPGCIGVVYRLIRQPIDHNQIVSKVTQSFTRPSVSTHCVEPLFYIFILPCHGFPFCFSIVYL